MQLRVAVHKDLHWPHKVITIAVILDLDLKFSLNTQFTMKEL